MTNTKKPVQPCTIPMPERPHPLLSLIIAQSENSKVEAKRNGWIVPEIYSDTDIGRKILHLHDAILKAGELRGYTAELSKTRDANTFCFLIRAERVAWRVRETFSRNKVPLSPAEMKDSFNIAMGRKDKTVEQPLGRLILMMTAHYSVDKRLEDKPKRPLIDRVPEILDAFETAVAHAEARTAEYEELRREDERHRAAAEAQEMLRANEKERWDLLRRVAGERVEAESLRLTADLIQKRLAGTNFERHPRTIAWMKWADRRIEQLDLLARNPEVIFERLIARTRYAADE